MAFLRKRMREGLSSLTKPTEIDILSLGMCVPMPARSRANGGEVSACTMLPCKEYMVTELTKLRSG